MTIDSSNALLILHFAWVMQDPNHGQPDQPQFSMRIKDMQDNIMNFPCGNVNFVASQKLTNLVCKTPTLVARDWTTVGFNLSSLMGQTIKIYFETRDCKLKGHYGYAYLVGECRPFAIDLVFCEGNTEANLEAPVGFIHYKWTRSSNPLWLEQGSGKTHQKITINNPQEGETFTCEVISELDSCSATLSASVTKTYVNANFVINNYDTCTRTATFADSSSVINGKKASVLWEISALNYVSNDSLFTFIFPDSNKIIDYLVRLTVNTENGCENFKEQFIRVYPSPQVEISGVNQICVGDSSYLKAVNIRSQFVNHQWTWTDENGIISVLSDSVKIYGAGKYKLLSTNTENCTASAEINVTEFSIPHIELVGKTIESCEGRNGTIQIGHNNAALPVSFLWNTGEKTNKLGSLSAGSYNVIMTDGNGCKSDTNIVIDLYAMPTHNVTKTHETCNKENGTITLTVNSEKPNTVEYIWENLTYTTSSLSGLKWGTYYVTIQDTLCMIKDTIIIEHIDIPIANFIISAYDTCTRTATFTDLSSVENGIKNAILWEIPDLKITSTDTLFTHIFPDPTTDKPVDYLTRLIVFAGNSCADTTEQSITIYPSPEIKINNVDLLCVGDSTYLQATVMKSQIKDYVWSWEDEQGITQTANENPIKIYTDGIYTLTTTNTENCKAYDTITVIAAPTPYIEVLSNSWETCNGGNGFIIVSPKNAASLVKYSWNTNDAKDTTNQLNMLKEGIYQVNMLDENGCKADTSIIINSYHLPTVFIVTTPETCKGENGTITLTVNNEKPNTLKYSWEGLSDTTSSLTGLKAETYKVIIQDTLCTIDTTIIIETIDGLIADFEIQSYDTCTHIATFANKSSIENGTIASIAWEIPKLNVKSSGNLFTYIFPDPPTNQSIEYVVRMTVTTQNNCVHTTEHSIKIYPSPKIKIEGDNFICAGNATSLKVVPIKSQFVKHIWNWKDESNVNQIFTGELFKIHSKGVYYLVSSNVENCLAYDTITVIEVSNPHINITNTMWETCEDKNGSIEINVENAPQPIKYIWNTGRKQDTTNRIDHISAGKYHVKVIDGNACSADTNIVIDEYPLPFIVGVEKKPERCYREDGKINVIVNSASPTSLTYQWEGLNYTTPSLSGLIAGIYKVNIKDSLCTIDTTIILKHIDGPVADFEINSYQVTIDYPFTLTCQSIGTVNTWNWNMGDGNTQTGRVATHSYPEPGIYKIHLEITDENGCMDSTSKDIHIFKLDVYIPNTFTPNGDGINDTWKPIMNEYSTEGYVLSVFDRFGQVIFFTTNTEEAWDGTINGKLAAPNTVYSYQLKVRDYFGLEYKFAGHVSLIR
jgi:gliding motility-associated-like protein